MSSEASPWLAGGTFSEPHTVSLLHVPLVSFCVLISSSNKDASSTGLRIK